MNETFESLEIMPNELDIFKRIRPYLADIEFLFERKIFQFKNGQAIIHKDKDGKIRGVEFHYMDWKT